MGIAMQSMKEKIIIIGGGVGPMAGVELHKKIIENTKTSGKDQDHLQVWQWVGLASLRRLLH